MKLLDKILDWKVLLTGLFLLLIMVIIKGVVLYKVNDLGVPLKSVFADSRKEFVKPIPNLPEEIPDSIIPKGYESSDIEGIIVITKDGDGFLFSNKYKKNNDSIKSDMSELLLQFGTGSGNAYACSGGTTYKCIGPVVIFGKLYEKVCGCM